jgi:hypothetical protein
MQSRGHELASLILTPGEISWGASPEVDRLVLEYNVRRRAQAKCSAAYSLIHAQTLEARSLRFHPVTCTAEGGAFHTSTAGE